MKTTNNIAILLPKQVFWDMDMNKLSSEKDKEIIIPRAVLATTTDTFTKDIAILEKFYTPLEIYNTLKSTKERISNSVCRMVSEHYKMPLFLRYKF